VLTMEPLRTTVVFRKFRDGDVIALFPEDGEFSSGRIMTYMHDGQHCSAPYPEIVQGTIPAMPEEYADLLEELKYVGYIPVVRKKCHVKWSCQYRY